MAALLLCFIFTKAAKSKDNLIPEGLHNFVESIVEGFENFAVMIIGEKGRVHVPFIGTLFLYILCMNWSGLIPLSKSPTANSAPTSVTQSGAISTG